eukprot:SM000049S16764  [mRNA]  locus=s49:517701:518573:- [translate_table: standard]
MQYCLTMPTCIICAGARLVQCTLLRSAREPRKNAISLVCGPRMSHTTWVLAQVLIFKSLYSIRLVFGRRYIFYHPKALLQLQLLYLNKDEFANHTKRRMCGDC